MPNFRIFFEPAAMAEVTVTEKPLDSRSLAPANRSSSKPPLPDALRALIRADLLRQGHRASAFQRVIRKGAFKARDARPPIAIASAVGAVAMRRMFNGEWAPRPLSETLQASEAQTLAHTQTDPTTTLPTPFAMRTRHANLRKLLSEPYYLHPPSFKASKALDAFQGGLGDGFLRRFSPAVAAAASDVVTRLVLSGVERMTGIETTALAAPKEGNAEAFYSSGAIMTRLVADTIGSAAYGGVESVLSDTHAQIRASRRAVTKLPPLAVKMEVHKKLMAQSAEYVAKELHATLQGQIRYLDTLTIQCLSAPSRDFNPLIRADHLLFRRETLVGSKLVTKRNNTWLSSVAVQAALTEVASFFPESTQTELREEFFDKLGIMERPAIYLYGRAGVGKTRLVTSIAKALDIAILETTLDELLSPAFFGPEDDWTHTQLDRKLREVAGVLHAAKLEHARSDLMIVVNEADFGQDENDPKVEKLKALLDTKNFTHYRNGDIDYELGNLIFVFTSNLPNDSIEALCRRAPQVTVRSEDRQRITVAEQTLRAALARLASSSPEDFVDAVREKVRRDMEFIRKVGNATDCGVAIIDTIVNVRVQSAVRAIEQGYPDKAVTAQRNILKSFRRNLGKISFDALDKLEQEIVAPSPVRRRRLSTGQLLESSDGEEKTTAQPFLSRSDIRSRWDNG